MIPAQRSKVNYQDFAIEMNEFKHARKLPTSSSIQSTQSQPVMAEQKTVETPPQSILQKVQGDAEITDEDALLRSTLGKRTRDDTGNVFEDCLSSTAVVFAKLLQKPLALSKATTNICDSRSRRSVYLNESCLDYGQRRGLANSQKMKLSADSSCKMGYWSRRVAHIQWSEI